MPEGADDEERFTVAWNWGGLPCDNERCSHIIACKVDLVVDIGYVALNML